MEVNMTEEEKMKIIYLSMKDIYKEFNRSVNNLVLLREYLNDVMNFHENNNSLRFDYPSIKKLEK
jgi:hypothetical protein